MLFLTLRMTKAGTATWVEFYHAYWRLYSQIFLNRRNFLHRPGGKGTSSWVTHNSSLAYQSTAHRYHNIYCPLCTCINDPGVRSSRVIGNYSGPEADRIGPTCLSYPTLSWPSWLQRRLHNLNGLLTLSQIVKTCWSWSQTTKSTSKRSQDYMMSFAR